MTSDEKHELSIVEPIARTCEVCGKPVKRYRKFCSQKCMGRSFTKTEVRTCRICGGRFVVVGTKAHPAILCSDECRRESNWRKNYGWKALLRMPSEEWKLGYIAGLIDGEGSVKMRDHNQNIQIHNTDQKMMEWLIENFGGRVRVERRARENRKDLYRWEVTRMLDTKMLLNAVKPYLVTKKERAQGTLEYIEQRLARRYPELVALGIIGR